MSDQPNPRAAWSSAAGRRAEAAWSAWRARKPGVGAQIAAVLVLACTVGLLLILLVPATLIGLAALVATRAIVGLRRVWRRITGRAAPADEGRRNVRVIPRHDA